MNEVAEFILRYNLIYNRWERRKFLDWLQWHADHQLLLKCIDFDGTIAGVLIIRTVMKPEDANEDYFYDPEGGVAYIELAIAITSGVLTALIFGALKRFGQRPRIAWKRPPKYVMKSRKTTAVLNSIFGARLYV